MMSAVKVSLSNRNEIPLPATSLSTKQLCPGDDRSYTYISRMRNPQDVCWSLSELKGLFHAHTSSGLSLIARVGGIVNFLFLGGACSDVCSLGWAVMACQLLLAGWLAQAMWTGLKGFVWLATVVLLAMKCIWFLSVPPWLL